MKNEIKNKNMFVMLNFFHLLPLYFWKDKIFKDKGILHYLDADDEYKRFYRECVDAKKYNPNYLTLILKKLIPLYKNDTLNKMLKPFNLVGGFSFNEENFFLTKFTTLKEHLLSRDAEIVNNKEYMEKEFITFENFIKNEIGIKESILKDIYSHFIVNLFPLKFRITDEYTALELFGVVDENNNLSYQLNQNISLIEKDNKTIDDKMNEIIDLLHYNDIYDFYSLLKRIAKEGIPFELNLVLRSANEKYLIIPREIFKLIKDFAKEEKRGFEFLGDKIKYFYHDDNPKPHNIINKFYGEYNMLYGEFASLNDTNDYCVISLDEADDELFWGINVISKLHKLQEKGLLKDVPGLFDLENKKFYFREFNNYYDLFKYASEMIREFGPALFQNKEHEFLKKYLSSPFNEYFKTCPAKEKAFIIDNFLKSNFFLSKIIVRLKNKELKKDFKEYKRKVEKEIENMEKIYSYFNKSPNGNLLRVTETLLKGYNGDFHSPMEHIKELENKLLYKGGKSIIVNKIVDFLYKNQDLFKLNIEELVNIDYVSEYAINSVDISPHETIPEMIEKIEKHLLDTSVYSFYQSFWELCSLSKSSLKAKDNFIKKLKRITKELGPDEKEDLEKFIKYIDDDFNWKTLWEHMVSEDIMGLSLNNDILSIEVKYMRFDDVIDYYYDYDDSYFLQIERKESENKGYTIDLNDRNSFNKTMSNITNDIIKQLLSNEILEKIIEKEKNKELLIKK